MQSSSAVLARPAVQQLESPVPGALRPLGTRHVAPLGREAASRRGASAAQSQAEQDAALVRALIAHEHKAWRLFTTQYSGVVLSCIRRVLGRFSRVTSEHDIDEVYARFCSELLAHDCKKLRAYDPQKGSRLSTWLGLLASNATYDYLRRLKRDRVCDPLLDTDHHASGELSPYDQVALAERARLASEILSELSERDREFVELYFGEGLDVDAIAARMGINVKTVYTKKHKITARLERMLLRLRAA